MTAPAISAPRATTDLDRALAATLRAARERRGLSRRAVALALDTTETTVYRWETAAHGLAVRDLVRLARVLGVEPALLLRGL